MTVTGGQVKWGVAGKVVPPRRRRGQISRRALIERVSGQEPDLVLVTAAAGYGKSTLLAEMVSTDLRRTAWLTLDRTHDEPAALLADIAFALDQIEPVDPDLLVDLRDRPFAVDPSPMIRFERMVRGRREPFHLVLDDAHLVQAGDAVHALAALVDAVPAGSTLTLGSRELPPLPLGRIRAQRTVVEVDQSDLALDADATVAMFNALAVEIDDDDVLALVDRTEGWPLALYLAALARRGRHRTTALSELVAGDSRMMVEYFSDVVLDGLDPHISSFLRHVAPLARFSGRLCDDVLRREGSAVLLEELHRRNLLVVALDERRQWYRLHHLLAEHLTTEFERREPEALADLLAQASRWHEANGDDEEAVAYAWRSGDASRTTSLVIEYFPHYASKGRHTTVERWIRSFDDAELAERPLLLAMMSLASFLGGDASGARRWLDRAVRTIGLDLPETEDGFGEHVGVALMHAGMTWMPPSDALRAARYAYERLERDQPWQPMSCMILGATEAMLDRDHAAEALFREGIEGTESRLVTHVNNAGLLAMLLAARDDWDEAIEIAVRARTLLGDMSTLPACVPALAASAMVHARRGDVDAAVADHRLARSHLARYPTFSPLMNLLPRIGLARASMSLGRAVEAATLLDETHGLLLSFPDAVGVDAQIGQVRDGLAARRGASVGFGPSSLTTAELRVLQYLPTHLTVAEIADRLYLSRNTVKTHTITIYRKLGTSTRSGAVDIARSAGLVE